MTELELSSNSQMKITEVVEIKRISFYVELAMFYFIALLYILAFTLDDQTKHARKLMLAITILFLAYDYYIHEHPTQTTIIDLLNNTIPLFEQKDILKRALIIIMAIIHAYFVRRKSEEKLLTNSLREHHTLPEYRDILQRLLDIYSAKSIEK